MEVPDDFLSRKYNPGVLLNMIRVNDISIDNFYLVLPYSYCLVQIQLCNHKLRLKTTNNCQQKLRLMILIVTGKSLL